MICLLARVMSFDLMALLLDPSLFRVSFYDLILCTVLLLWHSQRFEGAELYICRSQIFLKLKCQLAILQFSNKVKLRGPYMVLYLSNFGVDRMKIKLYLFLALKYFQKMFSPFIIYPCILSEQHLLKSTGPHCNILSELFSFKYAQKKFCLVFTILACG